MIANIAFANYRSCRASATASTQTQFLVGTGGSQDRLALGPEYVPEIYGRLHGGLNQNLPPGTWMKPSFGLSGVGCTSSGQLTDTGRPLTYLSEARWGSRQDVLEVSIGELKQSSAERARPT